MYERQIKRVVYTAKCECGWSDTKDTDPPKERLCKCGKWVKYEPVFAVGPALNLPGYRITYRS